MALTPQAALGNKPDRLKQRVKTLEERIDAALSATFDGRSTVSCNVPYDEDSWVIEQLIKAYRKVGWIVNHTKDPGDMRNESYAYLTFGTSTPMFKD